MRKPAMLGVGIAVLLLPVAAGAQVTLGARVGWGIGRGHAGGTLAMSDWVEHQVPLQLDVLYRVRPNLALGAFGAYAPAWTGGDLRSACAAPGVECSASVVRFGVQGAYTFREILGVVPWAGAGSAYEWNRLESDEGDADLDATFTGIEYLILQGGADWVRRRLSFGPYASVSVGRYDDLRAAGRSPDLDRKIHLWIGVGVRGKIDL